MALDIFNLTGKTALVTGASGGIGAAIARTLHQAGATVALSGTKVEALEALAAELGSRAVVVPANLSDPETVFLQRRLTFQVNGWLTVNMNNFLVGLAP